MQSWIQDWKYKLELGSEILDWGIEDKELVHKNLNGALFTMMLGIGFGFKNWSLDLDW